MKDKQFALFLSFGSLTNCITPNKCVNETRNYPKSWLFLLFLSIPIVLERKFHMVTNRIGNYRIMELLGEGTFAEVYLAEHIYLQRHAAIKILKSPISRISSQAKSTATVAREAKDEASFKKEATLMAG